MTLDTLITVGLVLAAAFYLYRKFSKARKSGGCGCATGSGCGGAHDRGTATGSCCGTKH